MSWNWELKDWPKFSYDVKLLSEREKKFLLGIGSAVAFLKSIEKEDYDQFVVEILSEEGAESSKIEGELLDRESLQSSIKKHFGINTHAEKERDKEAGMARILYSVYETFDKPLTDEMLCKWHSMLFENQKDVVEQGKYRTHQEAMQIVSHRYDVPKVYFEAPPSKRVSAEMSAFISWFNASRASLSILERAAITHLYFESIHPFEDGNGRIGRVLIEKVLSQGAGSPVLIAVSKVLEKKKKEYYAALERCNHTLEVDGWVDFFLDSVLQAQEESLELLSFLIEKSKLMTRLLGKINERQEKALLSMFQEGLKGFTGGLSAEKYIAITKTSRATATRDLVDLVEKSALLKTGELRHTRYWLNLKKTLSVDCK